MGWHAFYVGRLKEFYAKIVIATCLYIALFIQIIFLVLIGGLYITGSELRYITFQWVLRYKLSPPEMSFISIGLPTIFTHLGVILIVWALVDFFRIIIGKYIPKNFHDI